MGWNGKSHNMPIYTVSWRDSVREEQITEFENEVYPKIQELIEKTFEEKFAQEIAEGLIEILVN